MVQTTLGEGNTPLVRSARIGPALGCDHLFFKLENTNPSGSYKDRFAAAEVQRVFDSGSNGLLATSSGNTGSALAAYCARHGLRCLIVVNSLAAAGKLDQMRAHGASVFCVRDFTTSPSVAQSTFEVLAQVSADLSMPLVVSAYRYCPTGMAGVERMAQELVGQSESAIDHVFVPVGGGGLFTAVCRGFQKESGARPRIHAVQPAGCPTVVAAFEHGDREIQPVESTTQISGLSVPFDIDAGLALSHLRKSGGHAYAVTDEEVFAAQQLLLSQEGIYAEPAGAAALAGLCRARRGGFVRRTETVVCLVTGHGFKDPESIGTAALRYPSTLIEAADLRDAITGLVKLR